jgi:hypothetical protein
MLRFPGCVPGWCVMASSCEVTLTLGFDHHSVRYGALHEYLTAPLPDDAVGYTSGQHLDLVCGDETHPDGLPGSGQAGAIRIYGGLIRRGSPEAIAAYVKAAPWNGTEAVLVIHHEYGQPLVKPMGWAS